MPAAAARRTLLRHGRIFPAAGGARRRQRVELREGIGLIDGDGSEQQRVDSSFFLSRAPAPAPV